MVRRDEEFENFVARDYFEVKTHIVTPADERFVALWQACGGPYHQAVGHRYGVSG